MAARPLTNGVLPSVTYTSSRLFSAQEPPSLEEFEQLCSENTSHEQYPLATTIDKNIPLYQLPAYSSLTAAQRTALQDEWYQVLLFGPGVFVTKSLFKDRALIDRTTASFHQIIQRERTAATTSGDHFAAAGTNDRIWNVLTKHALHDPASFIQYYSNPYLALLATAWLGSGYRLTAQANNVRPGSAPQSVHRDYHLGFQPAATCAQFPAAMHVASQFLTLQGAVAHVDMPLESGPTRVLPYSQRFAQGFLAYRRPEFAAFFDEKWVALPLEKGDGIFFNPALFHAAGANDSKDVERMANLLQISSAVGKTMETIETLPILRVCWEGMREVFEREGGMGSEEVRALVAAVTSGYPFPTNMDSNPPQPDGLLPVGEWDIVVKGLGEGWSTEKMVKEFEAFLTKTRS